MEFKDCCRCCLENKGPQNQYPLTTLYDKGSLLELVESIAGVKILLTPDQPSHMCNICLAKFLSAEEIKMKFLQSEEILRSIVSNKVHPIESSLILEAFKEEYLEDPILMVETTIKQENDISVEDEEPELLKVEKIEPEEIDEDDEEVIENPKPKRKRKRPMIARPLPDISKQFSCDTCLELIPTKKDYDKHLQKHKENNDPPAHTCETCDQKFYKSSTFVNHTCNMKSICWVCQPSQKFSTKRQVQQHMTEEHLSDDKKFHCNFGECKHTSASSHGHFYHMSSHYEKQEFLCQHCSFTSDNRNSIRNHIKKHKIKKLDQKFVCDLCGTEVKLRVNFLRHIQAQHLKKKWQCDLCSHFAFSYDAIQFHKVNKHNLETPFRCKTCKRYFPFKSVLLLHEKKCGFDRRRRVKEAREEDTTCPHCNFKFSNHANLRRHIKVVHLNKRNHKCPYESCNRSFALNCQLVIHIRKHTKQKPLICPECPVRFSDPSVLHRHLKSVHKISGLKQKKKIGA